MDPLNNPTPTPNPGPTPGSDLGSEPKIGEAVVGGGALADSVASATPLVSPAPLAPPVTPPTTPTPPVPPVTPPVAPPTPPVTPVSIDGLSAPVNPIINPSNSANPTMGASALNPEGVAPTAPIMMPEPAPAPDPIEEELKAPMKATPPAPGSIGSAVSGPEGEIGGGAVENPFSENKQIPSVSFNDPAVQPEPVGSGVGTSEKPKTNPKTLTALIIVAVMVVIALLAVLLLQVFDPFGSPNPNPTPNEQTVIQEQTDNNTTNEDANNTNVPTIASSLSCTRNMTKAEVAQFNDAITGTISASAEFSSDGLLTTVSVVKSVTYSDEDATDNEPVEVEVHETTADELTPTNALNYYLPVNEDGELELTSSAVQTNYESLDFTCEVL